MMMMMMMVLMMMQGHYPFRTRNIWVPTFGCLRVYVCVCVLSVKVKLHLKIYLLSITNFLHTKQKSRLSTLNLAVELCSVVL